MSYQDNSKWRPRGEKHAYKHKPFKCVECGELVYAVGLCGYCEHCEANYIMLDGDIDNTVFSKSNYTFMIHASYFGEFESDTYFSEFDYELGIYPHENLEDG